VLGLLGALDPYKHKISLGQIDTQSDSGAVLSMSETKPGQDSELGGTCVVSKFLHFNLGFFSPNLSISNPC